MQVRKCCSLGPQEGDQEPEFSTQNVYSGLSLDSTPGEGRGWKQDWVEGEVQL